jgi:hypothetical protein
LQGLHGCGDKKLDRQRENKQIIGFHEKMGTTGYPQVSRCKKNNMAGEMRETALFSVPP